jgi:hypothetical protein
VGFEEDFAFVRAAHIWPFQAEKRAIAKHDGAAILKLDEAASTHRGPSKDHAGWSQDLSNVLQVLDLRPAYGRFATSAGLEEVFPGVLVETVADAYRILAPAISIL